MQLLIKCCVGMVKNFKKILCFDIDGVICKTIKSKDYIKSIPIKKNIKYINKLYERNYKIILFTARFMGRSNENASLAKKKASKLTLTQLKEWKLKFHKIYFGKPSYDLFIDDKNLSFKKNWIQDLKKKLKL